MAWVRIVHFDAINFNDNIEETYLHPPDADLVYQNNMVTVLQLYGSGGGGGGGDNPALGYATSG